MSPSTKIEPGQLIAGKYRVISYLGRGAVGIVYKVEQIFLRKYFALKMFDGTGAPQNAIVRFEKEAQLSGRLDHPNLVRAIDFGVIGEDQPFLVMDLVEGPTLDEFLKKHGSLSIDQALAIFIPICSALDYAHQSGMVHRDIKPGNIMLESSDGSTISNAKLVDFGIAKAVEETGMGLTKVGEVFGTPLYMSPEQCSGQPVDQRSDIYSLGCVMFEALAGTPPFTGGSAVEIISMHARNVPLSIREASMGRVVPAGFEQIINHMLQKAPLDRYQSCMQVKNDLLAVQNNSFKPGFTSSSFSKAAAKGGIGVHSSPIILSFLVAIALAVAVIGWLVFRHFNGAAAPQAVASSGMDPAQRSGREQPETPSAEQPRHSDQLPGAPLPDLHSSLKSIDLHLPQSYRVSPPTAANRRFEFPSDRPIGELNILDAPSSFTEPHGENCIKASGTVIVPKDQSILFSADGMLLLDHPEVLDPFGPTDLWGMVCQIRRETAEIVEVPTTTFDQALSHVKHLKSLVFLNLNASDVTCDGLRNMDLDGLTKLKRLNMSQTKVNLEELAKFKSLRNLEGLEINGNGSIKPFLKMISGSQTYQRLRVPDCDLTDDDMLLIASLPNLKELDCARSTKLTGKGLLPLARLKHLEELSLRGCNIKPADADVFKHFHLQVLTLPRPIWGIEDMEHLAADLDSECLVVIKTSKGDKKAQARAPKYSRAGRSRQTP